VTTVTGLVGPTTRFGIALIDDGEEKIDCSFSYAKSSSQDDSQRSLRMPRSIQTCICGHPGGTLRSPTLYGIQVNTRTPEISTGGSPGRSSQAEPLKWGENVLTQTELCGVSALPKRLRHRRNFPAYFLESWNTCYANSCLRKEKEESPAAPDCGNSHILPRVPDSSFVIPSSSWRVAGWGSIICIINSSRTLATLNTQSSNQTSRRQRQ